MKTQFRVLRIGVILICPLVIIATITGFHLLAILSTISLCGLALYLIDSLEGIFNYLENIDISEKLESLFIKELEEDNNAKN